MHENRVTETVRYKSCKDFNRFHGDVGPGPDQVNICRCASCGLMEIKGGAELTKFSYLLLSTCLSLLLNVVALDEWASLPSELKPAWNVYNHHGAIYHVYEDLLLHNPGQMIIFQEFKECSNNDDSSKSCDDPTNRLLNQFRVIHRTESHKLLNTSVLAITYPSMY